MYAFTMTLQTEILSTIISDFFKPMIILSHLIRTVFFGESDFSIFIVHSFPNRCVLEKMQIIKVFPFVKLV